MTAAPRKRAAAKAAPKTTTKGTQVTDDAKPAEPTPDGAELPLIEGADADNAMTNPEGDRFFPDSSADALIFNADHGATPEHPDRWPWPEPEPFDPTHCPTPGQCFPYGFGPDTSFAACIHGETSA